MTTSRPCRRQLLWRPPRPRPWSPGTRRRVEAARPRWPADARRPRARRRCCSARRGARPPAAAASITDRTAVALTARYRASGKPGLPVDRGDVVDDVDAADRAIERRAILERRPWRARCRQSARYEAACADRGRAHARRRRALASARARCPPVKPVAPVTRTRNAPPRSSRATRAVERKPSRASAPSTRRVTRHGADRLVQRDRQHELPVAARSPGTRAHEASRARPDR